MPIFAITLLFASAFLHTAWNLLLKQAGEKYIAIWWAMLLGSAIFLPLLFFVGLPARETWLLLFASVLLESGYYITLSTAYRDEDFSLVYPLARGTAPALIAIWSVLFLGEKFTIGGALGLGIIILGLLIVGGNNLFRRHGEKPHFPGISLAFLLAFLISFYSVIDGVAMKHTSVVPYSILIFFGPPLLTSPLILRSYGWKVLKTELSLHRIRLMLIGLLCVSAYSLVLLAYSTAQVSYAGAVREVSVVLGALAGWRFLGERLGGWRVTGSAIVFGGILVIAFWG